LSRFRLRFHLQEIDLRPGLTTLGRSEECEVTIEDPLVSRRHAQIAVDGDEVKLIDLGSRNGVRLNGKVVVESAFLADGDRVRIGTQDLVFSRVALKATQNHGSRTTGVLRLCAKCKLPFARESPVCPHCGTSEQTDEDTLSGAFGHENKHSWSVQLLLEATEKAMGIGRMGDAERMLRRATGMFEDRVAEGGKVEPDQVAAAAVLAVTICESTGDLTWGGWIPSFYVRAALRPPARVSELLRKLVLSHPDLQRQLVEMTEAIPSGDADSEDAKAFARLTVLGS
jgi:FHA domain